MALIFKRRHEIQKQQQEDPGSKLVNKMLMLGLVAFVLFSVLTEKRVLDNKLLIWQATVTPSSTNKADIIRVVENTPVSLAITEDDLEKLKNAPRTADGKIEVFNIVINQAMVDKQSPVAKLPENKQPETKQNLPKDALPVKVVEPAVVNPASVDKPAKTNVTP